MDNQKVWTLSGWPLVIAIVVPWVIGWVAIIVGLTRIL